MMDKLNKLTNTFAAVWEDFQYVSLRMWKEEGEVRFFISNLPPRNSKGTRTNRPMTSSTPRHVTESTEGNLDQQPAAPIQQMRGRPRKKRKTSPPRTPEIQRDRDLCNSAAEISSVEPEQNRSIVTIPCFNPFQALADHDNENLDQDYDTQNFGKEPIQDISQDIAQDNQIFFGDCSLDSSGYPKAGILKKPIFSTCIEWDENNDCVLCRLHSEIKPLKYYCSTLTHSPADQLIHPTHWHEQVDCCCTDSVHRCCITDNE